MKTEKEIKSKIEFLKDLAVNHSSATNASRYQDQADALRWVLGELN